MSSISLGKPHLALEEPSRCPGIGKGTLTPGSISSTHPRTYRVTIDGRGGCFGVRHGTEGSN